MTLPRSNRATEPPLQPIDPVSATDLARFDTTAESQRLRQLEADRDLLEHLMIRGYHGRQWDEFADLLVRYGITVIRSWARSGVIFDRCAVRQRPCCGRIPVTDPDEAEEVAIEAVAAAWRYFEKYVIHRRRWDPTKGASIKTFFVGACILFFSRPYDRWYRHERQRASLDLPLRDIPAVDDPTLPGRLLVQDEALEALLAGSPAKTAEIMRCIAYEGLTYSEIAELCDTTVDSVKQRVTRFRRDHPHLKEQRSA